MYIPYVFVSIVRTFMEFLFLQTVLFFKWVYKGYGHKKAMTDLSGARKKTVLSNKLIFMTQNMVNNL